MTIAAPMTIPTNGALTRAPMGGVEPLTVSPGPAFDVIDVLPLGAAGRLRALRQRSADSRALIPGYERVREAADAKIEAENAHKRLVAHPQDFGFRLPPEDQRVVAAQRRLDKATDDLKRLTELNAARSQAWREASAALVNAEAWLRGSRAVLEDVETVEVKFSKGETITRAIERHRARVTALQAEALRIEGAPFPRSHAKARVRELIEALAKPVDVSGLIRRDDDDLALPTKSVSIQIHNAQPGAIGFCEVPDAAGLLTWVLRDALLAKLDAEIDAMADDESAMTHEDRAEALSEVMEDMLGVERQELELVFRAQSEGLPVEHRADVDARALLGVIALTAPRGIFGLG